LSQTAKTGKTEEEEEEDDDDDEDDDEEEEFFLLQMSISSNLFLPLLKIEKRLGGGCFGPCSQNHVLQRPWLSC
jgi:hypothetical protein